MTKIILPHSGYKKLIVYKKSDVICRAMPNPYWDESLRGCRRLMLSKMV